MSAKTGNARLESEVKQERGNSQDLRKMLADERNVMSTMDMEHQQQLVELEQRHQEKVPPSFHNSLPDMDWNLLLLPLSSPYLSSLPGPLLSEPTAEQSRVWWGKAEGWRLFRGHGASTAPSSAGVFGSVPSDSAAALQHEVNIWFVLLGGQTAGTDWGKWETRGAEWAIQTGQRQKCTVWLKYYFIKSVLM